MQYISYYDSPFGTILLSADKMGLTGLWFHIPEDMETIHGEGWEEREIPILKEAKTWLDIYFHGTCPDYDLPLHFIGTEFQKEVWNILCTIPYGKTMTYGEIAKLMANRRGILRMSAQAVGGAVGRNPMSIIVPCHRVVGAGGNLTGFGGGLDKKISLLTLEKVDMEQYYIPKKGNKL